LKTHFYSKRELKEIEEVLRSQWKGVKPPDLGIERKGFVEEGLYVALGGHTLVDNRGAFVPYLGDEELLKAFPKVVVDMGAVKFVTNGANVMRPGIRSFQGPFLKGDVVVVVDEKHGKALAVGTALVDGVEAEKMERGPVVKNVHYIGDKFWDAVKELDAEAGAKRQS
jgi:PUA domain protein